jgi:hypothetical protein
VAKIGDSQVAIDSGLARARQGMGGLETICLVHRVLTLPHTACGFSLPRNRTPCTFGAYSTQACLSAVFEVEESLSERGGQTDKRDQGCFSKHRRTLREMYLQRRAVARTNILRTPGK